MPYWAGLLEDGNVSLPLRSDRSDLYYEALNNATNIMEVLEYPDEGGCFGRGPGIHPERLCVFAFGLKAQFDVDRHISQFCLEIAAINLKYKNICTHVSQSISDPSVFLLVC